MTSSGDSTLSGKKVATAKWHGSLKGGDGDLDIGSKQFSSKYTFASRFENGEGTNPEELLGAAEASCFALTLVGRLNREGYTVDNLETQATMVTQKTKEGLEIRAIDLDLKAKVKDIDSGDFRAMAEQIKDTCPVSKALSEDVDVRLTIQLEA